LYATSPPPQQLGSGAQQGSGAGAGAQHVGSGAQQVGSGAQHVGSGAQQVGSGAQHVGSGAQQSFFEHSRAFKFANKLHLGAGSQHDEDPQEF